MMDCPMFVEMKKMFQRKNSLSSEGKTVAKVKIVIAYVSFVDVNVATKRKIT